MMNLDGTPIRDFMFKSIIDALRLVILAFDHVEIYDIHENKQILKVKLENLTPLIFATVARDFEVIGENQGMVERHSVSFVGENTAVVQKKQTLNLGNENKVIQVFVVEDTAKYVLMQTREEKQIILFVTHGIVVKQWMAYDQRQQYKIVEKQGHIYVKGECILYEIIPDQNDMREIYSGAFKCAFISFICLDSLKVVEITDYQIKIRPIQINEGESNLN